VTEFALGDRVRFTVNGVPDTATVVEWSDEGRSLLLWVDAPVARSAGPPCLPEGAQVRCVVPVYRRGDAHWIEILTGGRVYLEPLPEGRR